MPSHATTLAIVNNTPAKIVKIIVSETNNYDWDGNSRPDHNFTGNSIAAYTRISEREELNANAASAWYTMDLVFESGDKVRFRNDQYDARRDRGGFIILHGESSHKYTMIQTTGLDWGTGRPTNMLSISPAFPSYADWMKYIPDGTSLTALTLPGTHDTGTWRKREIFGSTFLAAAGSITAGGDLAQCQSLSLRDQLDRGIRFIDVRCAKRDGRLRVYHGAFDQNFEFESDIVRVCEEFLTAHRSETIVMSLKHEGGGDHDGGAHVGTFEEVLDAIVRKKMDKLWYTGRTVPALGEVRGKIVLFRRCKGSYGISVDNWPDDGAQAFRTSDGIAFDVQDAYKMSMHTPNLEGQNIEKKWRSVRAHLEKATTGGRDVWFINFSSAASEIGVPPPSFYATTSLMGGGVNSRMFAWLGGQIAGRWGTIVMDFPEHPEHLIPLILSLNQRQFVSTPNAIAPVLLFQHVNYGGWAQGLNVGCYGVNELSVVGNDAVSSLKVANGYRVTLYEHDGYQGSFRSFTGDVPYIGDDFNDRASSLVVERIDAASLRPVNPCVLFKDANFSGDSKILAVGNYDHTQLGVGNDAVSSLRVAPGYRVTLYEHGGFSGATRVFTGDSSYIGDFNDKVSGVKVEKI